jgi:hypothetical protein
MVEKNNLINNKQYGETPQPVSHTAFCLEDYMPEAKAIIVEKLAEYRGDIFLAEALEKKMSDVIYMNATKEQETLWWLLFDKYIWSKLVDGKEKNIARLVRLQNTKKGGGGFGDAEIARAKEYPIDELIEFRNKNARCPFHNDSHASLYYYQKNNNAYCFGACGRSFDSIDIYQMLNGVDFISAVKALQ